MGVIFGQKGKQALQSSRVEGVISISGNERNFRRVEIWERNL